MFVPMYAYCAGGGGVGGGRSLLEASAACTESMKLLEKVKCEIIMKNGKSVFCWSHCLSCVHCRVCVTIRRSSLGSFTTMADVLFFSLSETGGTERLQTVLS